MSSLAKALVLQLWFFLLFPLLGWVLVQVLGVLGVFLYFGLLCLWVWELIAYGHYRYCRQEEFLFAMQTAAATQAPLESVLRAYLEDRPREQLLRGILLSFVFPGYYWIHRERSFDSQLQRVLIKLENGVPLDQALSVIPGVVSRETALAVSVGQFSGQLPEALRRLPERRLAAQWLEMAPRLLYPLFILSLLVCDVVFLMTRVLPKFEKIFADFRMKLPESTVSLMDASRWLARGWTIEILWWLVVILVNVVVFSSHVKWHLPVVGWVYRLYARGQFLRMLGLMLQTGKPLPEILEHIIASGRLPAAVASRVHRLAADLSQGQPLAASLLKHELATPAMHGLIWAAEKAQNLPWALEELGDTLARRSARISYRISMALFPLGVFACACLVAFVAISVFAPLMALLRGVNG